MNFLKTILVFGLVFFALPQAAETLGVGVAADSASGSDKATLSLSYELHATSTQIVASITRGVNLAGKRTLSADYSIERDFGHWSVGYTYDKRSVFVRDGYMGQNAYGSVSALGATLSGEVDLLGVNLEAGALIGDKVVPRFEASTKRDLFGTKVGFTIEAVLYPDGLFTTAKASAEIRGIRVFRSESSGWLDVPDAATWVVGPPDAPPNETYSWGLEYTWEL